MPGVARNNSELPSRVMKSWPDRDWICTMDEDEVGEEEEEEEDGMGWDDDDEDEGEGEERARK